MNITKDILAKVFDELKYRKKVSSQKEFGDILGYNKSYISELFNGRKEITNSFANALVAKFEISEQFLRTGDGDIITKPAKPRDTVLYREGDPPLNDIVLPENVRDIDYDSIIALLLTKYKDRFKALLGEVIDKEKGSE